jgi:hypothetical protein
MVIQRATDTRNGDAEQQISQTIGSHVFVKEIEVTVCAFESNSNYNSTCNIGRTL